MNNNILDSVSPGPTDATSKQTARNEGCQPIPQKSDVTVTSGEPSTSHHEQVGTKTLGGNQESHTPDPSKINQQGEKPSSQRATGPRTPQGKKRSSFNARKHGIFLSKDLLTGDESPAEFKALLKELRRDYPPVRTIDTTQIEMVAITLWKMRRVLKAEQAKITERMAWSTHDIEMVQRGEAWDSVRASGVSPGLLRPSGNSFALQEAIIILTMIRHILETSDFEGPEGDPWLFQKLYGLDQDGATPFSAFKLYQALHKEAAEASKAKDTGRVERLRKAILDLFDEELRRTREVQSSLVTSDLLRNLIKRDQALVSLQDDWDIFRRCWKSLSRELDDLISRLERRQRTREG
jgi:hypothetical protein